MQPDVGERLLTKPMSSTSSYSVEDAVRRGSSRPGCHDCLMMSAVFIDASLERLEQARTLIHRIRPPVLVKPAMWRITHASHDVEKID
jgi:hypothetical protein